MGNMLSMDVLARAIMDLDEWIVDDTNWGERALFYNPFRARKKGIYLAIFKLRDGENDRASKLGENGERYRFNIGLDPKVYIKRFGQKPERPAAGGVVTTGHDFSKAGALMPHPVYAWMGWAAVINPPEMLLPDLLELAGDALKRAKRRSGAE